MEMFLENEKPERPPGPLPGRGGEGETFVRALCSLVVNESVPICVNLPAFATLRRDWRWLRKNG
jgi:hypothetical protein